MELVSFKQFDEIYQKHVTKIYSFWSNEMQEKISKYNYSWRSGGYDFLNYLKLSSKRYYIAYKSFHSKGKSFCDIGGFWGVFPLTLKELGYTVALTEAMKYYDAAFDELFKYLREAGINTIDADPYDADFNISDKFDIISVMAVLEHYPYSPKSLFANILKLLNKPGNIYIEIPNLAYYFKRKMLLFGKTPITNIKEIYKSETPFIGHHHEYTMEELKYIIIENNLRIEDAFYFTYSYRHTVKSTLKYPLAWLSQMIIPSCREMLSVNCTNV